MFPIPWRLLVGVIVGSVIVKESRRASEFYDSVKKKIAEVLRKTKAKWNAAELPSDSAVSEACGK